MESIGDVGLWELSERECLSLISSARIGYLAVSDRALPTVVPVRVCCSKDKVEVESLIGNSVPLRTGSVVVLAFGTIGSGLASEWLVEIRGWLRAVDGTTRDRFQVFPATESFRLSIDVVSGWRRTVPSAYGPEPVELTNAAASSSK